MHLSIRTDGVLEESAPKSPAGRPLDLIVVIEGSPEDVLARRLGRGGRVEQADTSDSIIAQQDFNRRVARRLAGETGARLEVLATSGTAEATARRLEMLLEPGA